MDLVRPHKQVEHFNLIEQTVEKDDQLRQELGRQIHMLGHKDLTGQQDVREPPELLEHPTPSGQPFHHTDQWGQNEQVAVGQLDLVDNQGLVGHQDIEGHLDLVTQPWVIYS